jgi:hypothetical protein
MTENKKILELIMIVKNSGEVLRECLRKNREYIDHWTICDTGSTDNTKEIVLEELSKVPGNLYSIDFEDFSQARNKSIELSSKTCKYSIVLDDSYSIMGGDLLRKKLQKSKSNAFTIKIGTLSNDVLLNNYFSIRIFKTSVGYKYKYRVHEFLQVKKKEIEEINDEKIFIDDIETVEHKNRSVIRFKNDIRLLSLDLKEYPNEPRIIYYLAKTNYQIDNLDDALLYFKKLNNLKNIDKEYYFSALYESACINFMKSDDVVKFKNELINIQNKYPDRIEPGYKIAIIKKEEGELIESEKILEYLIKLPKPPNSFTIFESEIFDYFLPYLYIEVKLQLGKVFEIVNKLKYLLSVYPNNQPLLNMKYAITDCMNISSIELSQKKTIVLHTGGQQMIFKNWNPRGDKRISGSEYMAINLGKEFLKRNFKVIIIGSFEDKGVDNQGIVEGIQYIDYKFFSDFALKYIIDYLFVSRFTSNLLYYDNIKNVYLWVHDVLPIMDMSKCFQTHKQKFKGIIAVSNWQKNNIVKTLNLPEDRIIVSRNAIYPERFENTENIKKVPYRFIYTSDPSRGLSNLIEVLPKIKENYPETSLYIFALIENIDVLTLKKIKELDYVFLNTRLSQKDIAIEFLKSDIWFYPTDFKETYCITAVEAMCSKCLVCTINIGALSEIVIGKGILCDYPINNEKMLNKIFFVLERPYLKNNFIEKAYEWAINQTFDELANDWTNKLLK